MEYNLVRYRSAEALEVTKIYKLEIPTTFPLGITDVFTLRSSTSDFHYGGSFNSFMFANGTYYTTAYKLGVIFLVNNNANPLYPQRCTSLSNPLTGNNFVEVGTGGVLLASTEYTLTTLTLTSSTDTPSNTP